MNPMLIEVQSGLGILLDIESGGLKMKPLVSVFAILIASLVSGCASSPAAPKVTAPAALDTGKNAYFHVLLERPNGVDLRWGGKLPPSVLQTLEQQGKAVRPSRSPKFISYWAFMADGDFLTVDMINDPSPAHQDMSYAGLDMLFAGAPRAGTKWSKADGGLAIGTTRASIQQLAADDPASGGKAGEYVVAALDAAGKPVYYYVGTFVTE